MNTVFAELEKAGIETEMIHVGKEKIHGCIACHCCVNKQNEACSMEDDLVNEWIQKMKAADGILLGSPVHFSGVAGTMKSFLDRAFFVSSVNGGLFRHKVGATGTWPMALTLGKWSRMQKANRSWNFWAETWHGS